MASDLIQRLASRLFDRPLIQNSFRGELVEEMVAIALAPEWSHCGADWGACDLVRAADGLRIQVKQSAIRQSWHTPDSPKARPKFSIARKVEAWDGAKLIEAAGRNADIFIFALHPVDDDTADHRDALQWKFYVVSEPDLPDQDSMVLSTLETLAKPVTFADLKSEVEKRSRHGVNP